LNLGADPDPVERGDSDGGFGKAVLDPAQVPYPVAGLAQRLLRRKGVEAEVRYPEHRAMSCRKRGVKMRRADKLRHRFPSSGTAAAKYLQMVLASPCRRLDRERARVEGGSRGAKHPVGCPGNRRRIEKAQPRLDGFQPLAEEFPPAFGDRQRGQPQERKLGRERQVLLCQ
jgi:hypothetical protein